MDDDGLFLGGMFILWLAAIAWIVVAAFNADDHFEYKRGNCIVKVTVPQEWGHYGKPRETVWCKQ